MKKRILSCFMALALCLTLLPATAQAEDGHAPHPDAFENAKWLASSSGEVSVRASSGSSNSGNRLPEDENNSNYVILNEGYYYLSTSVENYEDHSEVRSSKTIKIQGNVTICLNGKQIQKVGTTTGPVFEVPYNSTLTLTDCTGNGQIIGGSYGSGVYVNGGTLNLYSGQITNSEGQTGTESNKYGGGVYVNSGNFNMYGGDITGNSANYGGGVYVKSGTFTMDGGTIKNNTSSGGYGKLSFGGAGVYMESGNFIMNNDASVTENTIGYGSTGGAGVYVNGGKFEMNDNASVTNNIANNSSGSSGGGVYVSGGTFEMNGNASVSGNTAKNGTLNGAGVYVLGGGTFTMDGRSKVTGNAASGNQSGKNDGGGVYVSMGSKFEMNGEATSVSNNTATGSGGGVFVAGSLTMNGNASVTGNKATVYGGGVHMGTSRSTVAMNGTSSIKGNTAGLGGGVYVGGAFTVADSPTVMGNKDNGGAANNVYLDDTSTYGKSITIGDYGLKGNAESIGVTTKTEPSAAKIVIATNVSTDCSGKFFSDDTQQYVVKYDEPNSQLVLAKRDGTTTPPTHKHEWTYTANGATIKATCTGEGVCEYKTKPATVEISMTTTTYPYSENMKAPTAKLTYSNNWPSEVKKAQESDITYWEYVDGNCSVMSGAPKNIGKYKAEITVGGKTASVEYEITDSSAPAEKTDPTYTAPTAKSGLVYTGENQSLIDPGSTNHGRMWYKRGTDDVYSTLVPMAKDAGSYTVYYKVEGDATHNDVAEKSIEVRIEKAQLSGTPTFTKVTEAGKTLKDVTLTKPESWPDGKFEWGNGVLGYLEDKPLVQGKAYSWLYLADNYYAEGTVVLWADPSSSGGGSSGSYDSNPIVKTETKNNPDGSTTKTETRRDGSVTQTTTAKDGSTGTVKTDKHGQTEAKTALSNKAVEDAKKNGEAVKAPVEVEASRNSNTAPTVKVELPKNAGETEVEIPVSNAKPGTVAVLVHPDGTEEILKDSISTENGIRLTVDGNATVKIIDNSKDFIDTRNHWAEDAIDFVSARGLVNGMSATIYAPNNSTTRAQLWTILARQNDADLSGGSIWYEKAQNWAKSEGVSDGANPNAAINRAQMVTMLWRTMGQPAATDKVSFADVPAGSYYAQAVAWAVENGITTGVGGGRFDPAATCTRAQIAAFLTRLYAEK